MKTRMSFEGKTRIVLLVGKRAIKIARIRPISTLLRLLTLPFSSAAREKFFEKYGAGFFSATLHYLFVGIVANRNEYALYQAKKDSRVAPTLALHLGGLVAVQVRGAAISQGELKELSPFNFTGLPQSICIQLENPNQYCYIPSHGVVLVDYGDRRVCELLSAQIGRAHV